MDERLDVVCMGEALVDFLPDGPGRAVREVERWIRCTGGSLANVAVGLARLGGKSALVSVVGQDEFGAFLRGSLEGEGVDVRQVRATPEGKTGLVFISLGAGGERSFSFHRTRSAELFLGAADVHPKLIARAAVLHCGTNSLLWEAAQAAMVQAVEAAWACDRIVSCDPNLRLHFWPDPKVLQGFLRGFLPRCTVVKLSHEEIEFATGCAAPEAALEALARMGVLLPVVTLGAEGAVLQFRGERLRVQAPAATVRDTTGAGDGFMAGFLLALARMAQSRTGLAQLDARELRVAASFGCAVGSRVVQQLGAVAGLPRLAELDRPLPAFLR